MKTHEYSDWWLTIRSVWDDVVPTVKEHTDALYAGIEDILRGANVIDVIARSNRGADRYLLALAELFKINKDAEGGPIITVDDSGGMFLGYFRGECHVLGTHSTKGIYDDNALWHSSEKIERFIKYVRATLIKEEEEARRRSPGGYPKEADIYINMIDDRYIKVEVDKDESSNSR